MKLDFKMLFFIDIQSFSDSLLSAERSVGMRLMSQNIRILGLYIIYNDIIIYGCLFSESSVGLKKMKCFYSESSEHVVES